MERPSSSDTVWGADIQSLILEQVILGIGSFSDWRNDSRAAHHPCRRLRGLQSLCVVEGGCSEGTWSEASDRIGLGRLSKGQLFASCRLYRRLELIDGHANFDIIARRRSIKVRVHAFHGTVNEERFWEEARRIVDDVAACLDLEIDAESWRRTAGSKFATINRTERAIGEDASLLAAPLLRDAEDNVFLLVYRNDHSGIWTIDTVFHKFLRSNRTYSMHAGEYAELADLLGWDRYAAIPWRTSEGETVYKRVDFSRTWPRWVTATSEEGG